MFRSIAAFELRYQLSSPVFSVSFVVLLLLAFWSIANPYVQLEAPGATHVNAPDAVVASICLFAIFSLFIVPAFVANAVVRDDDTGFGSIIRATPTRKFDYLFGRFTGAVAAALIVLAAVPIGLAIGQSMPWLDSRSLGPFMPGAYLYGYFCFGAPTLIVLSAIFFALATATRSVMASYLGVVAFLILYGVSASLVEMLRFREIGAVIDPFCLATLSLATKYWTAFERNTTVPSLTGIVGWNRVLWLGVSIVLLSVAYRVFHYDRPSIACSTRRSEKEDGGAVVARHIHTPIFDRASLWTQFLTWRRFEMRQVLSSPAYIVLLSLGMFLAISTLWFAFQNGDVINFPVTRIMIMRLENNFKIVVTVIAIIYAGELVWRDRETRTNEILDACPIPDWIFVVSKITAIAIVLFSTFLVSSALAVAIQALNGFWRFEFYHYLVWYILPQTLTAVQLAALVVIAQTLSPHKYIGCGVVGLYLIAISFSGELGWSHHLYLYATLPTQPTAISDMNGKDQLVVAQTWFQVYWSLFALVLATLAYGLWRRGAVTRLAPQLSQARRRFSGLAGAILVLFVAATTWSGAYIYYNTNILNDYSTGNGDEAYNADYERALLAFEKVPQPRIANVKLNVDVFPHDTRIVTTGIYRLENRTLEPLSRIHVRWLRPLKMERIDIDGGRIERRFDKFDYVIFALDEPLAPGGSRELRFESVLEQIGFKNSANMYRIADNGTFVTNNDIAPMIGMSRRGMLSAKAARRRQGLPEELRPFALEDYSARANHYVGSHDADWVLSDLTVSTVADQTPVAPGYEVSHNVAGGRRTARFISDRPILNAFSIHSAAYSIKRDKWRDVDLAVYHHPPHAWDVDRMIEAMKASFDVLTQAFGPFQFQQMRILEYPAYNSYFQEFANTVAAPESLFIGNSTNVAGDPEAIDTIRLSLAGELSHQWWGHQIAPADMQGRTFLNETVGQYSMLLIVEHLYGKEQVRNLLKLELDRYLKGRGREGVVEVPLIRVENQGYIFYGKGAVVMHRLEKTVGEEVVNRTLRRLLAEFKFKPAPYPSSKDFLRILREEAGPAFEELIVDLFERITIYDLKAVDAQYAQRPDGKFELALTIEAHKFYSDGKGKETEAPFEERAPVGAFLEEPGKKSFDKSKIVALQDTTIHSGRQTLRLVVDRAPVFVGVDPYNEWIDRNSENNITKAVASRP